MSKPIASLSLDLDNKWSYLKTHGDAGWQSFPSYLDIVVPRVLRFLQERNQRITFFIVGQDAALPENRAVLRAIAEAGHEVGSHSFKHEPWLHLYSEKEIETELATAEESIAAATGVRPRGFRGPGFSCSAATLTVLARRGYQYDASTFPTFLGPLARFYYFLTARFSSAEKDQRRQLFGKLSDGLRPLRPYRWQTPAGSLIEIPVTTMPGPKLPMHASYLLYLAAFSPWAARAYLRTAVQLCRLTRTAPSFLLHPTDFLDTADAPELAFFPAMKVPHEKKLALLGRFLDALADHFQLLPMQEHAARAAGDPRLPTRMPSFN
jgi:hypothetical protein